MILPTTIVLATLIGSLTQLNTIIQEQPHLIQSARAETVEPAPAQTIESMIATQANIWGIHPGRFLATAKCESGLRHEGVYGDNGKAYGIMQFHRGTFDWFAKMYGKQMDYYSREDQIELAAWAFANGYASHWTCFNRLVK